MRLIEINNIIDGVYSGGLMTFSADIWFSRMVWWLVVIPVMIVWPVPACVVPFVLLWLFSFFQLWMTVPIVIMWLLLSANISMNFILSNSEKNMLMWQKWGYVIVFTLPVAIGLLYLLGLMAFWPWIFTMIVRLIVFFVN